MKRRSSWSAVISLLLILVPVSAYCSNILGVVNDSQGNSVNGCNVNVTDSTGKVIRDAKTDLYGRYCIPAVDPGTYTMMLDPGATGMQSGNGVVNVQVEGLTVDWKAAANKSAVAS